MSDLEVVAKIDLQTITPLSQEKISLEYNSECQEDMQKKERSP